jgi:hypothetical protein
METPQEKPTLKFVTNDTRHLWETRHLSVELSGKREPTGSLKDGTSTEQTQIGKVVKMISISQLEVITKIFQTPNLNLVDVIENLKILIHKV